EVRSFFCVCFCFPECFQSISRVHLIRFSVSKRRGRVSSISKRTVEGRSIFNSVGHNRNLFVSCFIQGFSNRYYKAVHHLRRGNNICVCLCLGYSCFGEIR